jgi:hypothetical protein
LLGGLGQAKAAIVTFDDIPQGWVPDGYGDINWGGIWYKDTNFPPAYAPHSPPGLVYVYWPNSAAPFSFPSPVEFEGAWFSGYWSLYYDLYLDGVNVATSDTLSLSATPTFLGSGYAGLVDKVVVHGSAQYYVMDDVTYAPDVPEPTTLIIWSLLGALAIGLGWWRRKNL